MLDFLDPVIINQIKLYGFQIVIALIKVIIIFIVGRFAIRQILKATASAFERWNIEPSLRHFFKSFLRMVLYIVLILIIAQSLDVKIAALLGVLGAAGLAVGLALQGSLANFAGGILILIFKPFKATHIIEAQGFLGTVERIEILHTHLRTFDNRMVVMPNGALANSNVTNLSANETRRVEMSLAVAYGTDISKVREVIFKVFAADQRILTDPEPVVKFIKFGDSSLDLTARCWTLSGDLWPVYWDNMEAINNAFVREGIEVPFPQRTVHLPKTAARPDDAAK